MQLNELQVKAFGQLKNRTFTFASGLYILSGENEQGKSTLLACIKAMFFGLTSTKRTIRENDRTRYLPWDGTAMAANLIFTHQGSRYRLERTFGKTKAGDQVRLMNDTSGVLVELPAQQEVGQFLFGVTLEEFINTVFIGQLQSPLEGPDNTTLSKLGNLFSTMDEKLSYAALDKKLREAQVLLKLEKGVGGQIPELQKQIEALSAARQVAIEQESSRQVQLNRLSELTFQITKTQTELTALDQQIQHVQVASQRKLYSQLQARQAEIERLKNTLETEQQVLLIGGAVLSEPDLVRLRQLQKNARDCEADLNLAQQAVEEATLEQTRASASWRSFADLEGIDRIDVETRDTRLQTFKDQLRIGREAARHQAAQKDAAAAQALHLKCQADVAQLEAELKSLSPSGQMGQSGQPGQGSQADQKDGAEKSASPLKSAGLIAGIILILLGAVMGILIHPALWILTLGGIILLVLSQRQSQIKAQQVRSQVAEQAQILQQLQIVQARLDAATQLCEQASQAALLASTQLNLLQCEITPEAMRTVPDPAALAGVETEIAQLQNELTALLSQCGSAHLTELYVRLSQAEQAHANLVRREEILKKAQEKQAEKVLLAQESAAEYSRAITPDHLTTPFMTGSEMDQQLNQIAALIARLSTSRDQICQLEKALIEATGGLSWAEYVASLQASPIEPAASNPAASIDQPATTAFDAQDIPTLQSAHQALAAQLEADRIEAGKIDSAIRHSPKTPFMAVEYDQKIASATQQLGEMIDHFDALSVAREQITAAYEDLQATFGPVLNEKAASILHQLTGGKYKDLKIDRKFNIKVEAPDDGRFHEWDYYSGGTIDQIYLALRLSVTDLITGDADKMPLLLDDIFVQYDDERTAAGLRFLYEKVAAGQGQALLLTSHNRISELAGTISPAITIAQFT